MRHWWIPIAALAMAAPLSAQQWQVAREQFAFAGRQLTIHVEVESEGTLRVIRGAAGHVRVAGSTDTGATAAGLTADEHLTLTAVGYGPVDFMVTVPENVWVDVRLPDRRHAPSMSALDRSRAFQWGSAVGHAKPPAPTAAWAAPVGEARESRYIVFIGDVTPESVALPDLGHIRTVTVRVEGSAFRVGASRPLELQKGDPDRLEIRPVGPPLDLTLFVPAGTDRFRLEAGDVTAVTVRRGEVDVHCSPSTRQWLPGGRAWVTLTPAASGLDCDPAGPARTRG